MTGGPASSFCSVQFGRFTRARTHPRARACWVTRGRGHGKCGAAVGTGALRQRPLIEIGRPYCWQSLAPYIALSFGRFLVMFQPLTLAGSRWHRGPAEICFAWSVLWQFLLLTDSTCVTPCKRNYCSHLTNGPVCVCRRTSPSRRCSSNWNAPARGWAPARASSVSRSLAPTSSRRRR